MRAVVSTGLVARSAMLPAEPDLLTYLPPTGGFFFAHAGRAVVGVGTAHQITVPGGPDLVARAGAAAADVLNEIEVDGPHRPLVVGALPYDDVAPATLTVPRNALVREPDGTSWQVVTGPPGEPTIPLSHYREAAAPTVLRTTAVPSPEAYRQAVATARARIAAGQLSKVVLARMLVVQADHDFDRLVLLAQLRLAEPDAYTFAAGGFVGASPELLVARAGQRVWANPLAGTAARLLDPLADAAAARALLDSAKDRGEHAPVAAAVAAALAPVCTSLDVDAVPRILGTSTAWHLSTQAHGVLGEPLSALALAGRLHPTPAVCGSPRPAARAAIRELERIDRRLYAGLVGWTDASGDGEWAVVLRCAEVQGRIALLFAGAGIVASSDPEQELAETELKFGPMLAALGCS